MPKKDFPPTACKAPSIFWPGPLKGSFLGTSRNCPNRAPHMLSVVGAVALLALVPASAPGVVGRRALVVRSSSTAAAATLAALGLPQRSLAAGFTENLRAAESSLASASADEVMGAIESIATLSEEYGGMPSNELRAEVVNSVRAKRQQLKVFVFAHPPISPTCRTPLFPTSHRVFCLRRMDRRREMSGMASRRSRSPYPHPTPPYPSLPLSTPT